MRILISYMHSRRLQSGFTLLELAVVLTLVGLMAAFGMEAANGLKQVECTGKTAEQLARIQISVQAFTAANGRVPKPALMTLGSSHAEFGKEVTTLPNADLVDTGNVLIGSLPHVTLGLPIELAADCWGNKFTYAVTETLTSNDPTTGYGPSAGAITFKTGTRAAAQDLMTTGAYVVVSHGSDKMGATPLSAANIVPRWCTLPAGTEIDRENCDVTNDVYFDGPVNMGTVADNEYDDIVVFEGKDPSVTLNQTNVYCWGENEKGQIGDGSTTDRLTPTQVVSHSASLSFTHVSSGNAHSCGVTDTGMIYCWGSDSAGALANGPLNDSPTPETPVTLPSGVSAFLSVEAGRDFNCALADNGRIYCWGTNTQRQVITPPGATDSPTLVPLPVGVTSFSTYDVGMEHACAIGNNGKAYCWGSNFRGQIGNGTTLPATTGEPVTEVPLPSGITSFTEITTGRFHTCGVGNTGQTYCWGATSTIGDGTSNSSYVPKEVSYPSGITRFRQIQAGDARTCAFGGADNRLFCWGIGRLATGGAPTNSPAEVVRPSGVKFSQSGSGGGASGNTCAIAAGSYAAYCWGSNYSGPVGDGTVLERQDATATTMPAGIGGFSQISLSDSNGLSGHTCAVAKPFVPPSTTYTWGANGDGQAGTGSITPGVLSSPAVTAGSLSLATVSSGSGYSCALTTGGEAYCWGNNSSGKLGNGAISNTAHPTPISVLGGLIFDQISAGWHHTCGLVGSSAYCWGSGSNHKLGNGSTSDRTSPTLVSGSFNFQSVETGQNHTCALSTMGDAYCWGANVRGQLGTGNTTNAPTPVAVVGGIKFREINMGGSHSCGRTVTGSTYCWGYNLYGQLGNGSTADSSTPVLVKAGATSNVFFKQISIGWQHSCGITNAGAAYCWGLNDDGELGTGTGGGAHSWATPVAGGLTFASINTGERRTCGITTGGDAYCWGINYLGDGSSNGSNVPVLVSGGLKFKALSTGSVHTMAISGMPD